MMSKSLIVGMMFLLSLSFVIASTPDIFGHEMAEINWIASVCGVGEMMVGFLNTGMPNCQSSSINSLSAFGGSPVDAVYVDADGNVGIGTNNPMAKLHVAGDNTLFPGLFVENTVTGQIYSFYAGSSGVLGIGNEVTKDLLMSIGPTGDIFMKGNVGIGTDSPGAKLEIASPTSGVALKIGRRSGEASIKSSAAHLMLDSGGTYVSINHYVSDDVVLGYGGGNVGIGTVNPGAPLEIKRTDSTTNFLILHGDRTSGDSEVGILFKDRYTIPGGQNVARIWTDRQATAGNFDLVFSTSDAGGSDVLGEAMRIDHLGNVGIGTTSPSEELDVVGDIVASGTICDSGGSNCIGGGGGGFGGWDNTNSGQVGGTGANLVVGTTYQAATDGYAMGTVTGSNSKIYFQLGTTSSVSDMIVRQGGGRAESQSGSIIVPVPEGWFWKMTIVNGALEQLQWLSVD